MCKSFWIERSKEKRSEWKRERVIYSIERCRAMFKSTYHLLTCAKQREVYTAEEFKELLGEKEQDNSGPARARLTLNLPHCVSGFDLFKLACMCKVLLFKYIKTSDAVGVFAQRLVYLKTERQKPPESKSQTERLICHSEPYRCITRRPCVYVCVRVCVYGKTLGSKDFGS